MCIRDSSKTAGSLGNFQPVKAVVSRHNAQYKLYFRNETTAYSTTILNATIIRGDSLGFSHSVYPFTATHGTIGEIQEPGQAWDFHSVNEWHVIGVKEDDGVGGTKYQVYHMDIGNSFNGKAYQSYMTLPFNFLGSPHRVKKYKKLMMNIDCTDNTTFKLAADFGFGADSTPKETGEGNFCLLYTSPSPRDS